MRGKVVVAEANLSDLEHIASILRNLRLQVLPAQDGKTALELVRTHQPDLVLASLDLPHLDGYKLSKEMRESQLTERIPFMFIVGRGELPDRIIGHETYAHDYIQKPISVPDFKSRINALLKMSGRAGGEGAAPPAAAAGPERAFERRLMVEGSGPPAPDRESARTSRGIGVEAGSVAPSLEEVMARMRALLAELTACLKQLEESSAEKVPGAELATERSVPGIPASESSKRTTAALSGMEEERGDRMTGKGASLVDRFLAEYREKMRSSTQQQEVPPKGVEDILASFRKTERAGRSHQSEARESSSRPDSRSSTPLSEEFSLGAGDSSGVSEDRDPEDELPKSTRDEVEIGGVEAVALERAFKRPASAPETEESDEKLYMDACEFVLESIRTADAAGLSAARAASQLAQRLIRSLGRESTLLLAATDRTQGYSVSTHAVNVAILTIRLGQILARPWEFLCRIGISGLLHELGVARLPARLMYRNGSLSTAEIQKLRERPLSSAGILREMGPGYSWLGEVVGQVHERENGSGVPLGLNGRQLREEAKLLGAADFFEACIHERPYRSPMTGYQALYELATNGDRRFADHVIKGFIRAVSLYPYNEFVVLNTREVGRVIDINEEDLSRPCVELLYDRRGAALEKPVIVDLSKRPELQISKAVNVRDLPS